MTKGFTLIELLVVIAILAILTTVAVLVLNPAQILAESRDVQRLSDLDTVRSAINLYLTTATSVMVGNQARMTASLTGGCGFSGGCVVNGSLAVDGTGWVGMDLRNTSGGSPLSVLPLDPSNGSVYAYAYQGNAVNRTFELNGRLESVRHQPRMAADGGNNNTCTTYTEVTCFYEVGSDPGLDL